MGNAAGQDLPPTHQGIFCETTALSPEIKLLFRTEREPGAAGCGGVRSSNFKLQRNFSRLSNKFKPAMLSYRNLQIPNWRSQEVTRKNGTSCETIEGLYLMHFCVETYFCISYELLYSFISEIREGEIILYESSEGKVRCRRGTTTEIRIRITGRI